MAGSENKMKIFYYGATMLMISFLISGSLIYTGTWLVHYLDPTFSISLLDLLVQVNLTAWLLVALLAGIIFAGLSMLPLFSPAKQSKGANTGDTDQLSD